MKKEFITKCINKVLRGAVITVMAVGVTFTMDSSTLNQVLADEVQAQENHLNVCANGWSYPSASVDVTYGQATELYTYASADEMDGLTYEWSYIIDDTEIPLETTTNTCITEKIERNCTYYCKVTDAYGNSKSAIFYVHVDNHSKMYLNGTDPMDKLLTICFVPGEEKVVKADFSADNTDNLSYCWWYHNSVGQLVILSTTDTCTFDDTESLRHTCTCTITDCYGNSVSAPFCVGVENHLKVYANHSGDQYYTQTVDKGADIDLSVDVEADNTQKLIYYWERLDSDGSSIWLGSNFDTYKISGIQESATYVCRVTDYYGNSKMAKFRIEVDNSLKVYANGEETDQFEETVNLGQSVELNVKVEAENTQNVKYVWYRRNYYGIYELMDDTDDTFNIENIQRHEHLLCELTDYYGNQRDIKFSIAVENQLKVTANGGDNEALEVHANLGEEVQLLTNVSADNMQFLRFQWYYIDDNGEDQSLRCYSDTCVVQKVQKNRTYYCIVTDYYGNERTAYFSVHVDNNLKVYPSGSSDTSKTLYVSKNEPFTLMVDVTADDMVGLTYNWYYSSSDDQISSSIPVGEDPNVCQIEGIEQHRTYRCEVTDCYGNSKEALFHVYVNADADTDGDNTSSGTTDGSTDGGTTGGTTTDSSTAETPGSGDSGSSESAGGAAAGAAGGSTSVSAGGTGNISTAASTTTDEKKDDSKTEKKVTTNKDGSVKEVVKEKETNSKGTEVTVTTTTEKDKKGNVTSVTEKTKIDNLASDTSATVTVKTDKKGSTTATASIEKKVSSEKKTTTISSAMIEQIKEAAGTDADITLTVKNEDGNTKYKVKADTADLKAGKDLYVYKLNTKTGEYVMVNDKTYTVSNKGNVSVQLDNKGTYELVSATDAKKIEKKILATVQAKKTTASVKKGKKTSIALSSKLNMSNVESITYNTDSKSVATVSKKGKVTAKSKGTTTIKAKVTLKNGKTKTVKMKVTVK